MPSVRPAAGGSWESWPGPRTGRRRSAGTVDGLDAEVLAELGVQPGRGGPQRELLVDGQIGVVVGGQGDGTVGHVELR